MRDESFLRHHPGFRLPVLEWVRDYQKPWIKPDIITRVPEAAVVLPRPIAYATFTGRPVQFGLYTAFVPMVVDALFGTHRENRVFIQDLALAEDNPAEPRWPMSTRRGLHKEVSSCTAS